MVDDIIQECFLTLWEKRERLASISLPSLLFTMVRNADIIPIRIWMDPFKHKDTTSQGYVNPSGNWPTVRINFPLIRFAEMLLFRAEAYLMTGQPAKAKEDLI